VSDAAAKGTAMEVSTRNGIEQGLLSHIIGSLSVTAPRDWNIDRSEPDALLFQVTPEYTIEEWPLKSN
jgi:hypothetical protein